MLWWKSAKFLMSFSKPRVRFYSNFTWLFRFMKDNSSVFFRSKVIYFEQKRPIKAQILETFGCLDQNSSNSCYFLNNKSVLLQILHQSSVSEDITPLYFLAEILYTFGKRSLSIYKFGEISPEQSKLFWKFTLWWASCKNYVKFQLKRYRKVICHDTEEWCRV